MIKPFYNRRFGDWDEAALGRAMLALEREYFKRKRRGFLPCDLNGATNVVVLGLSNTKSPSSTTTTGDTSTRKPRIAKRVVGMDRSKTRLAKMAVRAEAMEMLHKMRHIDPELAEKLEKDFKDEGMI
jgi:hypothetical protein